ncbi:MAG: LamG domain-containing protein, partial [Candidatus Pacebacteria bacterium]|nr:LamG domain-containing protein [Candidatus Paceibacterota bacterium]
QALDQWQPVPGEGTHRHVIGDILYDADYLHVRLRDLALLERPVSRDDPAAGDYWKILWGDQDEQSVWQITVNPEGKTSVKRRTRNTETSIDELTMDVASNVGEDDWTVLVAIPLTVLPVQQNTILMNFARGSGASNDLALYAPTNRKLKDLDSFARVILGNPDVADVAPVAVSEEGLILSWDFENDDDIVRDGSSMGNTGELKGPVLREDGPFGRCIRIRGLKSIQNHVELNNLKGLKRDSPFTFSMWVNLEMSRWHLVNHTVKHTILEIPSGILIRASNPGRPSSGRPSVICPPMDDTSAARLESNIQTLTPLAWEHLAVTYDGRRVVLYVNGRLAAQADSVKLSALGDGTGTLRLGTHSSGKHHRHFRGLMDGVKIYRRAWSHDEVLAHYRQGLKHIKHWVSEHVGEE